MRGGGSCHINVSLINSCTLQITVEDDGCDVSEKALLHLDESFFRVNNSRSNVKGSGLGLAISKRILMNHGASVKIANKTQGSGLCVTIQLKLQ